MPEYRKILGINFFYGSVSAAVDKLSKGGLLVVPAAPALVELETNAMYRDALAGADLAITDSAFMVLYWNRLMHDSVKRLSGLEYVRELLRRPYARVPGNVFWIMAGEKSARTNLKWLEAHGVAVPDDCVYLAPMYGEIMDDPKLLALLEQKQPQHIVLTLGGGTQERLGLYLKRNLSFLPGIHCIGAAIAFLTGDQVYIPVWADKFYMGWLFRSVSEPRRYIPRYWKARRLLALMRRYSTLR